MSYNVNREVFFLSSFFIIILAIETIFCRAGCIFFNLVTCGLFYLFPLLKHKKIVQNLNQKIRKLKDLSLVRGMFISVASHEFRNPMTNIYSSVDLLENFSSKLNADEKRQLFDNVRKSIRKITRMMDDILLIGKLQHRQISFQPKFINILNECSSIAKDLDVNGNRVNISVAYDIPQSLSLDMSLFYHIFSNLLSNALKYSQDIVNVKIQVRKHFLAIDVQDKGIGIPPQEVQRLSHLFNRCSNTQSIQGIGIGMFLVCHCIKLHKGQIFVKSIVNSGSTFRILLPITNE